ncbi:MAG: acetyltransferase [Bacteroidaceae bacterium]|nr:acetyltransferase [Bacteroidaceae bacterium]
MILYGASGHGKVIKDIVEANGGQVKAFVDDNLAINELAGLPVLHKVDDTESVIVSIGVNATRKKIVEKLKCHFGVAIHPSAVVSPSAKIGEGTVVMAGAVINAGAVIGKHCIINTGASVDHECVLGDYVHIAPHAALCGQVHVGEGTLMGVGSCAIPCMKIGSWTTVGAGSTVVRDVPDGVTVVGNPARVINL